MPNIGPLELGIILLIVLLIFGAARLPALASSLGTGLREFKDSLTGHRDREKESQAELKAPIASKQSDESP